MKRLILIAACLPLLTPVGRAQQRHEPPNPNSAPGAQVVTVPGSTAESAPKPCADAAPVRVAVVIKGVANLRDRANIAGKVVGEVRRGGALVIEAEDGPGSPWYDVTEVVTGRRGWVHGDMIRVAYRK